MVSLLGLVGTPPTAVFLGKLQVFTAAIDGGYGWLAVLAVANTVASLFYYLRWLAPAFLPQPGEAGAEPLEPGRRLGRRRRLRRGRGLTCRRHRRCRYPATRQWSLDCRLSGNPAMAPPLPLYRADLACARDASSVTSAPTPAGVS